ncbi:ABC transporter permease [Dyella amyloliquefaciens]|uniref:ABC transporter permease n=1 Tax=Dyella amyloliquefaciens TaxID=1770545 RepID=UPI00197A91E6|nr:ABC transporter permease [Dyella amyloliquefaciens]
MLHRPLTLIYNHRVLLKRMCWRDISSRYRESVLGSLWAILNPLLMLSIYTFVFGFVLKSRWPGQGDNKVLFSLTLFAGLIIHGVFAETASRSTSVISENANYVKKVVFPLEILPLTVLGSAAFHAGLSLCLLVVANALIGTGLHWTVVLVPVIAVPILLATSGMAWILASLGVYLRDASQIVTFVVALLMYLSPVFYPLASFPERYRPLLYLNPLTLPIEQLRDLVIRGEVPSLVGVAAVYGVAILVTGMGLWFFERSRVGFADVV